MSRPKGEGVLLLIQGRAGRKRRFQSLVAEPALCPLCHFWASLSAWWDCPWETELPVHTLSGGIPYTVIHVTTTSPWNKCKKELNPTTRDDLCRVTWPGVSWAGTLALSGFPAPTGALLRRRLYGIWGSSSLPRWRLGLVASKRPQGLWSLVVNSSFYNTYHAHKIRKHRENTERVILAREATAP